MIKQATLDFVKLLSPNIVRDLINILKNHSFKKYLGTLEGNELGTVPKSLLKRLLHFEFLRSKMFFTIQECNDNEILGIGVFSNSTRVFKGLCPFDKYLNRSIS